MSSELVIQKGILSKDNSIISGSLNVTGTITGSLYGTASYVISSSYANSVATASFVTASFLATSASYAISSLSSSYAETAQLGLGPTYAPTNGMGYLYPNIVYGDTTTVGGGNTRLCLYPILIKKTCDLVSMAIPLDSNGNYTVRMGIYSDGGSMLPLTRIYTAPTASVIGASPITLREVTATSSFTLYQDTIYWLAVAIEGSGRYVFNNNAINYNPLLGYRITPATTIATIPFYATGSNIVALPASLSQDFSTYIIFTGNASIGPSIKVSY